jgi:hypothetical protein
VLVWERMRKGETLMSMRLLHKLHKELSETQNRRHNLDISKIAFISALLGFGSIKLSDLSSFYQLFYLVPLVTLFFDMLIMGEHFSIKRIGAFLRLESPDELENSYEKYVSSNRDIYFKNGSRGFSILSMIVSFVLLGISKKSIYKMEYSEFDYL